MSKAIKTANELAGVKGEAAQITHIAMYIEIVIDGVVLCYVFESTMGNSWTNTTGVQLNPYRDWIKNYKGKVWARELSVKCNLISAFVNVAKYVGTPYESGIGGVLQLLRTVHKRHNCTPEEKLKQLENLHCSETDVKWSQDMSLFDKDKNPSNFPPYTFALGGEWEKHLLCDVSEPKLIKG
jgi:hypothetical protein